MKKLLLMLSLICLMTACDCCTDEDKCETLCTDSTSVCCDSTKSISCAKDSTSVCCDSTKSGN